MIPQQISRIADGKPSCIWRCACGLALIIRLDERKRVYVYRGKRRTACPHCKADLPELST